MPSEREIRKMINRHKTIHAKLRKDCSAYEAAKDRSNGAYEVKLPEEHFELQEDWAFLQGDLNTIFEEHPEREIREAVGETIFYPEEKILENELRLGTGLTEEELKKVFRYQTDYNSEEGLRAAELLNLTRRQYLLHVYRTSFKPFEREISGKELGYSPLRIWLHHFSMEGRDRGYLTAMERELNQRPLKDSIKLMAYALYKWLRSA